MNPSSQGWVLKYGSIIGEISYFADTQQLYKQLRQLGFIYGLNVEAPHQVPLSNKLSDDEIAKINLLFGLHQTYLLSNQKGVFSEFLTKVNDFYRKLETVVGENSSGEKERKSAGRLEKVIHERVSLDTNVLTKNFSNLLINAVLYVDILLFENYLEDVNYDIRRKAKFIEKSLLQLLIQILDTKRNKATYDRNLLALFTASATFRNELDKDDLVAVESLHNHLDLCTLQYFIDLSSLAIWSDGEVENQEEEKLIRIASQFGFSSNVATEALQFAITFFKENKTKISLFSQGNIFQNFYGNITQFVYKLIIRNKKRIWKEISGSRELVLLLTKSTQEELSKSEKKKIRTQLIDICKVIPSLAIFILPGGSLLLPIFIKLIPNILPSSFDDNRLEDNVS